MELVVTAFSHACLTAVKVAEATRTKTPQ